MLGICKDVALVLTGVVLYGDHVSAVQLVGYCVSLTGFGAYNYIKLVSSGTAQPSERKGSGGSGSGLLRTVLTPPLITLRAQSPQDEAIGRKSHASPKQG